MQIWTRACTYESNLRSKGRGRKNIDPPAELMAASDAILLRATFLRGDVHHDEVFILFTVNADVGNKWFKFRSPREQSTH